MKCRHNKLVNVDEMLKDSITHIVEDGERIGVVHSNGTGEITGVVNVYCEMCKKHWTINRFGSLKGLQRTPKWIVELLETLGIPFTVIRII